MRNARIHFIVLVLAACSPQGLRPELAINTTSVSALAISVRQVSESRVLSFDAVNISSRRIAVTPAFGYDFYFNLEIENDDGVPLDIPAWELTREIRGRCLRTGEKLSFRVPLERWDAIIGSDAKCPEEPCFRVKLRPGSYRVRVRYRPVRESTVRSGCAGVPSTITSEWFRFEVRKRDAERQSWRQSWGDSLWVRLRFSIEKTVLGSGLRFSVRQAGSAATR
jgi:hypothetical protein